MSSSHSLNHEIIGLGRSLRGYLTESHTAGVRRENKWLQALLKDKKVQVLSHAQSELDSAFADLEALMAVTIPYWLDQGDEAEVKEVVEALNLKYPASWGISYISTIENSLGEIQETLHNIMIDGVGALEYWFGRNNTVLSVDDLGPETTVVAPLTTDYFVARLYLAALHAVRPDIMRLFPAGFMPGLSEMALPTVAISTLAQPETKRVLVMVDKDITGTTSGGVHQALKAKFPDKTIHSTRAAI
jgi:hypothetical protein